MKAKLMLPHYACPHCGVQDSRLQLSYPCWVNANDPDSTDFHERMDWEASPQKDGTKGWCANCDETVMVKIVEPGKETLTEICREIMTEVGKAHSDVMTWDKDHPDEGVDDYVLNKLDTFFERSES